jgi:hypothetical protein
MGSAKDIVRQKIRPLMDGNKQTDLVMERLSPIFDEVETLRTALGEWNDFAPKLRERDEELRELLTVLRNEAAMLDRMGYADTAGPAMHAAATRLGKILDGEG